MRQLFQDLRGGDLVFINVPSPAPGPHEVTIRTRRSLISPGTERMINQFASASYVGKARQQPDRVREVIRKVRTDGLASTVDAVQGRLDQYLPLGYCNVGEVVEVGSDVEHVRVGDRVVSNGPHAEMVTVSKHLVARIPDGVTDDEAAFVVIGAIALQGVRLIDPTLGERVAVVGLGLVGLLAAQILRANGCRPIGFDVNPDRVELAQGLGLTAVCVDGSDPVEATLAFTDGVGADGVLITASSSSDEIIRQAARMARRRGRIVLTGVVGLDLDRADFYDKELTFSVSCSYGPGRYDPDYEEAGVDYPIGYVRWTEQRNFTAVLDLLDDGAMQVEPLTTRRVDFDSAAEAFEALADGADIGIVLRYPDSGPMGNPAQRRSVRPHATDSPAESRPANGPVLGIIGAGAFTTNIVLPALAETQAQVSVIASRGGVSGSSAAHRFGIDTSTTEVDAVLDDPAVRGVVITTRHDSHADLVVRALDADKDVFVEKPLAIDRSGLSIVRASFDRATDRRGHRPLLMVGFNRRFAPSTQLLRKQLGRRQGPAATVVQVNAGSLPPEHWTHDPDVGGGRIVGEACHFIDLVRCLVESPIVQVVAVPADTPSADTVVITLVFADGSVGTVHYVSVGPRSLVKERVEVLFDGKALQIHNFRSVRGFGVPMRPRRHARQRKGHAEQFGAFVEALTTGGPSPIPFEEIVNVTEATFAAVESMQTSGSPILVGPAS